MPEENLESFFRFYNGEPHQMEAVQLLQQSMPQVLLRTDSAWIKQYRNKPEEPQSESVLSKPLTVPYDCQLDNPSGDGWRECFARAAPARREVDEDWGLGRI